MNTQLNTFDEINDSYLQAYNRLVVAFNLVEEGKLDQSEKYLSSFNEKDRLSISVVGADIQNRGWKNVKVAIKDKLANTDLIDEYVELNNES